MPSGTYEVLEDLQDSHPIKCLMLEHERLLAWLDELERLTRLDDSVITQLELLDAVASIARFLIACEPHHQREEQALFPILRERGVGAAADAMVREHDEIRVLQHALLDCTQAPGAGAGPARAEFERIAAELLGVLRDHVAKEDYILYPLAVELIDDVALWRQVSERGMGVGKMPAEPHNMTGGASLD